MAVILGSGAHRYEVVDNWAKLPPGQEFNADVAAVGIDKQDRVYAFNRGKPTPYMSGEPFHRCTHTALSPQGDLYVSDGYGNSRVHKFAPNGTLLFSWGEPGTDPGQFNIAHNICCDADGWVYVADRENHRVQVFDGNGKFETQWI